MAAKRDPWLVKDILDPNKAIDYGASLLGVDVKPLPTGFPMLDAACKTTGGRGLANWWYVVVGGASNAGKTQTMNHLIRQGMNNERHPGLITMEVPLQDIQQSFYSQVTSFGFTDFLPWKWEQGDSTAKCKMLADEVRVFGDNGKRSLTVAEHDGRPGLNEIMDMAYSLKAAGCEMIAVDYLQLIKANSAAEITELATEVSEELRLFAHKERILTIALSQLNRTASRERSTPPISQDLWGGTAMEANANMVLLLDHSLHIRDGAHDEILRTNLIVDKFRHGPNRFAIPIEANMNTGKFREGRPDEESLWIPPKKSR